MNPGDRKRQLLQEFETIIAPQKAQLAQRLPALFQQYYDPPQQLPAAARAIGGSALPAAGLANKAGAGKRPQQPSVAPDAKRVKTGAYDESDKRVEALFREINNLINRKLWGKKEAVPFKEPVDPIRLRIPDYFNYIKHPMDLGTVKQKLQAKQYATPLEVCEDVRLIWKNCATYNQVGNPVRTMGDQMSDIWEKAWAESRIEEQWNQILFEKDPTGRAVPYKLNQLNTQLKAAVQAIPAPADNSTDRQMSEIEKRKLSVQLGELQGDQLNGVLEIVQQDLANLDPTSEDEIELDIDALPSSTLWKLKQFVDGHLHKSRGGPLMAPHKRAPTTNGDAGAQPTTSKPQQSADEGQREEQSEMNSSESEPDSPQEVKGSTMDDPHVQNASAFVKDGRQLVDESATAPREQSTILKDRAGPRKAEVQVNADNWNVTALQQPTAAEEDQAAGEGDGDEMWENFKTIEEQKRKQAEEQRKLKEQQEEELRKKKAAEEEEAKRLAAEAEEKERKLKEEEERIAAEEQRARMEQCDKEVDEIKAKQGTANLVQQNDMQALLTNVQSGEEGGLAAVGLAYKDDEDVNFDSDAD
mmetsp:Transcript_26588/g.67724  ORF Transcript_26588/g.67724 Transcript_26588/m.67724 type:complete len:585 (-) Transcript_26588:1605-3359(-)|eukprot:CAMPEP_0202858300 /NCGR_PEP_ID=MMETSP1391-20130828/892_1 /ASSEMBLY_ACC=CAM_ASM_000867 /TAXON_ID=1034604 /ORGANISM="Chlamydomonas leiostraca, Strain SAG 11-49" /LENGTH=584 /DNA_ID=CAMNT_0049537205 /DNA_START=112 /DNA_END=1866 /DNA_ORIENTATION=+